jgi:hypothetical protein
LLSIEEVAGTELEGREGFVSFVMAGEEDDGNVGVLFAEGADDADTIVVPEEGIDEGGVEGAVFEDLAGVFDGARGVDAEVNRRMLQFARDATILGPRGDHEDPEDATPVGHLRRVDHDKPPISVSTGAWEKRRGTGQNGNGRGSR